MPFAVSFVKKPDFFGPKHKRSATSLLYLGDPEHPTNRETAMQNLQDGSAHPQYAAWARMMTPPDKYEQMPVVSAA